MARGKRLLPPDFVVSSVIQQPQSDNFRLDTPEQLRDTAWTLFFSTLDTLLFFGLPPKPLFSSSLPDSGQSFNYFTQPA